MNNVKIKFGAFVDINILHSISYMCDLHMGRYVMNELPTPNILDWFDPYGMNTNLLVIGLSYGGIAQHAIYIQI